MIISIEAEKALSKIQHPLMIKIHSKREGSFTSLIKSKVSIQEGREGGRKINKERKREKEKEKKKKR